MVFEVVSDSCNNSLLCGPWNMIMIIPWKLNLASFDLSANTKSNYVSCFTASPKVSIEIWNICVRLLYWESFQHCREYTVSQSTEANQVKWDKEEWKVSIYFFNNKKIRQWLQLLSKMAHWKITRRVNDMKHQFGTYI